MFQSFLDHLRSRMLLPLPGEEAQWQMAAVPRRIKVEEAPEHARKAGVLALFYPIDNQPHVVLIERPSGKSNDRHGGQLSFPGGKYESEDITLEKTALREAYEEVGIPMEEVELLGPLTELYIPVSNFLVYPFVGVMQRAPEFVPQKDEVADIIEIPFNYLLKPEIKGNTTIHFANDFQLQDVPYFDINGKVLWGATAMMISELIEVVCPFP